MDGKARMILLVPVHKLLAANKLKIRGFLSNLTGYPAR